MLLWWLTCLSVSLHVHTAPSASAVEQVTVEVVSSTSVNVSWLPTSRDNWNGIITRYTVEYKLTRSVSDMIGMYGSGVVPTVYGSGIAPTLYLF